MHCRREVLSESRMWEIHKSRFDESFTTFASSLRRAANAGHDTRSLQAYLGHSNIQHTVRYTELAPDRFKDFWKD
jgi:integrase